MSAIMQQIFILCKPSDKETQQGTQSRSASVH